MFALVQLSEESEHEELTKCLWLKVRVLILHSNRNTTECILFLSCFSYSHEYSHSGKSTVIYSMKSDKSTPVMPTMGADFDQIKINDISLSVMQEGGRSASRPLLRASFRYMAGIIFVIDSNDRKRIDAVRDEIHQMLNDENLQNKPFLILANEQDLPDAMKLDELRDKLNLDKLVGNAKWHLQPTSAIRDEGIHEGFIRLADSLVGKCDPMKPIMETFNDAKTMHKDLKSIFSITNLKTLFK